ncbi:hypothetical protein BHE74_00024743 [Ensete ventricosum]|nr:hypothetical protein BHE74_00024743 [Ensete ventricosum]
MPCLLETRFAISICTARYGWYISVCQVIGTRTARYRVVPPKIDCWRWISGEINHWLSIEEEKGKKKKKRKRRKKNKNLLSMRRPRPRVARASSPPSPAGAFSPARGDGTSPRAGRKIEATNLDVSGAKEPKCSDNRKARALPPADAKRTRSDLPAVREREERGSNSEV